MTAVTVLGGKEIHRQVGVRHVEGRLECGERRVAVGPRIDDVVGRQVLAHVHDDTEQRVA